MRASADIFSEREDWRQPLAWSVAFHALLFGSVLLYGAVFGRFSGEGWGTLGGGGEGAISANLVSTIPLPSSPAQTANILANESKGLTQSLPKAKEEPTPEAIPIPEKNTRQRPQPKPRTSTQEKPQPVEEASNRIPFGQGGPVSGPYGVFSAAGAKGGFGFNGGGGGDFGTRFAWYVRVVQQTVSQNWLKYEIDPNIHDARRVYITFDIMRSGQPKNIQIEQSSGVPSLDQSAVRALQRIDSFGALPPEYAGNRVSVEFWFDYRR